MYFSDNTNMTRFFFQGNRLVSTQTMDLVNLIPATVDSTWNLSRLGFQDYLRDTRNFSDRSIPEMYPGKRTHLEQLQQVSPPPQASQAHAVIPGNCAQPHQLSRSFSRQQEKHLSSHDSHQRAKRKSYSHFKSERPEALASLP